jgi:hypothetical protein
MRLICPIKWVPLLVLAASAVALPAQDVAKTAGPAAEEFAKVAAADLPNAAAMRALRANASFHLHKAPLADFASLVSKRYRIPVRLDLSGLKRAGVDPQTQISANMDGVSLNTALQQLLGPVNLAHCLFNGVVLITDRGPRDPLAPVVRARAVRRIIDRRAPRFVERNRRQAALPLMPEVQVEILFVRKVCAPSDDQLQAIKTDLRKCLTDLADAKTPPTCDSFPDTLAACVANHLSKEQAARYRGEVERRKANEREACISTFIVLVDQELGLSEPQRKSLVAALRPKWKPAWSQMIEETVREGRAIPAVPDELIVPTLGAEQTKLWAQMPKIRDDNPPFDASRIGAVGTPVTQPGDQ